MQKRHTISKAVHRALLTCARSQELRDFLELLWATGGTPHDLLGLSAENIDWGAKRLSFLPGKRGASGPTLQISIQDRLEKALRRMPAQGKFFPQLDSMKVAAEFAHFRRTLPSLGEITPHSYRVARASRIMKGGS